MARLKDYYKQEVAPALMKKFSYKSVMQIPKLDKICLLYTSCSRIFTGSVCWTWAAGLGGIAVMPRNMAPSDAAGSGGKTIE